jgi:hypothetical protein
MLKFSPPAAETANMRRMRPDIIHSLLERAKAAQPQAIRPVPWMTEFFGISRQQATRYLANLCEVGQLSQVGRGRGAAYYYKAHRHILSHGTCVLPGIAQFPDSLGIHAEQKEWLAKALTALIQNSAEHSRGRTARWELAAEDDCLLLTASDDGNGIFAVMTEQFRCLSRVEAAGELLKGSRIAKPVQSTSSLAQLIWAADFATIEANGMRLKVAGKPRDWSIQQNIVTPTGTTCTLEISTQPRRFHKTSEVEGSAKIVIPVQAFIATNGTRMPDRRDAKRILKRVISHETVILDFRHVDTVAQSFVDYVFNQFRALHPRCGILPVNLNNNVRTMINLVAKETKRRSQAKGADV